MTVEIICVGRLKEAFWKDASKEYIKRLGRFCKIATAELSEKSPAGSAPSDVEEAKEAEGKDIIRRLKKAPSAYIIALDIYGKEMSSEEFAEKLSDLAALGKSHLIFIIGGPNGLSREVLSLSDFRLSFSKMTFPHRLMRVILLEQIYRAFKIQGGEAYHK